MLNFSNLNDVLFLFFFSFYIDIVLRFEFFIKDRNFFSVIDLVRFFF